MNLIDQIDAVIFDLDGTLLDTETLSSSCLLLALREFGVHLSEVRWDLKKRIIGLPGREWTTIVIDSITTSAIQDSNAFQSISWQRLLERWEYYMSEYAEDVTMLPGVEALLSHCHKLKQANNLKPLRFAIATSSRKSAAEKKLSRFGLMKDLMDVMVFGDDDEIVEGKPKPDIFLLTARRLGVRSERCLVFEDSLNGIKAGKAASMIVIAVPDPRIFVDDIDCEEYRRRADFCYSSITDVIPSLPLLL